MSAALKSNTANSQGPPSFVAKQAQTRGRPWGFLGRPSFGPGMGLPYGSYPRLVFVWLVNEAYRTKSRHLVLGDSLSHFMRQLGLIPSGGRWGSIRQLREQMQRLLSARVSAMIDVKEQGRRGRGMKSMLVADQWELVGSEKPRPDCDMEQRRSARRAVFPNGY